MEDTLIDSVLSGKLDRELFIKWLQNEETQDLPEDCVLLCCNKNDFVAYFLAYLRSQTESLIQSNSSTINILQTPKSPDIRLSTRRKHHRSISDPTNESDRLDNSTKLDKRSDASPITDRKKHSRVKTKLFTEEKSKEYASVSSDDSSRLSTGVEGLVLSSTPMKNGVKPEYPNVLSPVSPGFRSERCDTPRSNRHSRSQDKSLNFGDFLASAQRAKKKKSKNMSNDDSDTKIDLDLSNSEMFPEIGAKKPSKKRVKPLQIDQPAKSVSLTNFSPEYFQQPSPISLQENTAFKYVKIQPKELSKNYDRERNMLKQEKQKVMDIFNSTPTITLSPHIRVLQKDPSEPHVKVDLTKVVNKEKLEILVEIYDVLLKNNVILSFVTELYFLISILLTKQTEKNYKALENEVNDNNATLHLLKNIHNCTYFAVKALWTQKCLLEVILDKNSLKTLGENKNLRAFYPELAKFLLNSYGLKCEEDLKEQGKVVESNFLSTIVRFNQETDNADNFPNLLSFQNFKKQRDMFQEILRGYHDAPSSGTSKTTFRSRIKTLLSCGQTPTNYAHLVALFIANMCAECLIPNNQESRLSKLKRRFTCPVVPESHRLPNFAATETFYKEFIMYTDNEAFRVHLRDALSSEIVSLDSTPFGNEDKGNTSELSKDYLILSKKLRLLAKFLGYLTSLPYTQVAVDGSLKNNPPAPSNQREQTYTVPKEKVLENNLALRNYSQPNMDLRGIIQKSIQNGRLIITIPWLIHYLSMLDYVSLRINYFKDIITTITSIYKELRLTDQKFKKNTIIFLKATLGWFFDLPHYPRNEDSAIIEFTIENCIDYYDLIDESILFELCPYLKDIGVLLSTCRVHKDQKEVGFKHVTPVTLILKPEDLIKNKEKELQAKLEEEFLRSQPSSTRRVLEVVVERVTSGCVREVSASVLTEARTKIREQAAALVRTRGAGDMATLLESLHALYTEQLHNLRARALELATTSSVSRTKVALSALLPSAPPPLAAIAARNCANRVKRWLADNWNTTAVLCKDIEAEMRTIIALNDYPSPSPKSCISIDTAFASKDACVSPAAALINLKEVIASLLDYEEPGDITSLLSDCAASCSAANMFNRPPTQRAILQLSIDLCIVYVSRKPKEITDDLLNKLHAIWHTCCPDRKKNLPNDTIELPERRNLTPEFRNFDDERAPTPISDDEINLNNVNVVINQELKVESPKERLMPKDELKITKGELNLTRDEYNMTKDKLNMTNDELNITNEASPLKKLYTHKNDSERVSIKVKPENSSLKPKADLDLSNTTADLKVEDPELLNFFDRVLCTRNIVLLSASKCNPREVWEAMACVLVYMLNNNFLSEESLTEQCLAIYTHEWPQSVQENLSTCMKAVSTMWSKFSVGKFTLILDFMSEYCTDMEYEPFN